MNPPAEQKSPELAEIKALLERICDHLGIGKVPPQKIVDLREKARQKALEIKRRKG